MEQSGVLTTHGHTSCTRRQPSAVLRSLPPPCRNRTKCWATPEGRTLVELAADLVGAADVPLEDHLGRLNPALKPTYNRLHEVLMGLGPDMTTRSKVKGPAYVAQRKIADLRFVNDYIRVLIRGLDPKDPDAAGLRAGTPTPTSRSRRGPPRTCRSSSTPAQDLREAGPDMTQQVQQPEDVALLGRRP